MRRLLVFIVATAATIPAIAAIYRWVDEQGVTHYSHQPPPGQQAEAVGAQAREPRGAPAAGAATSPAGSLNPAAGRNASELNCVDAVEAGRASLDRSLAQSRAQLRAGEIDEASHERTASELKQLRRRLSVSECAASEGELQRFYLCIAAPETAAASCAKDLVAES